MKFSNGANMRRHKVGVSVDHTTQSDVIITWEILLLTYLLLAVHIPDEAYGRETIRMSGMSKEIFSEGPSCRALHDAFEDLAIPLPDMQPRFPKTDRDARSFSKRACRSARYGQVVSTLQLSCGNYEMS